MLAFRTLPENTFSPYNPQLKHHALREASPNQEWAVQGAPSPMLSLCDLEESSSRKTFMTKKYFFALSSQSTIGPNYFNPLVATQMRTIYGSDLGFSKLFLRLPKSYSNKHVQGFWHSPPQSPIHRPVNNRNAQNSLGSLLCIVRQKFKTLMNVVKREKKNAVSSLQLHESWCSPTLLESWIIFTLSAPNLSA